MNPNLQLVHSNASCAAEEEPDYRWEWSGADPAKAAPPRVLTEPMRARLEAANRARRALLLLGYEVLEVDLYACEGRAVVRIARALDLRPLLDAARPERPWFANDRLKVGGHVIFENALVCWEDEL